MSNEEIIKRLSGNNGPNWEKEMERMGCWGDAKALREAIALLSTRQDAQTNEPLTLKELRLMGGQPVWVESPGVDRRHSGRWGIVDCVIDQPKTLFLKGDYTCHDYGTLWVAYRRPPKEDEKGA